MNKYSVSPKMPRSGAQSQVFRAPAIFMNLVYSGFFSTNFPSVYSSDGISDSSKLPLPLLFKRSKHEKLRQ